MRRLSLAAPLIAGLAVMTLSSVAVADVVAGEDDYRRRCAACHGEKGLGEGPIAFYFTAPPPALAMLAKDNGGAFPADRVIEVIDGRDWNKAHGGRAMPIWGEVFEAKARESLEGEDGDPEALVAERIADLVEYLETLQVE